MASNTDISIVLAKCSYKLKDLYNNMFLTRILATCFYYWQLILGDGFMFWCIYNVMLRIERASFLEAIDNDKSFHFQLFLLLSE